MRNGVEGTGLGLSIVDAVMSAHGGNVTVTSEVGKGSTFTLFFPITEL
jgi:two-component system OmpR family sensor kinase